MSARRSAAALLTGAGIGLVNLFAMATADCGLGVSNAFESAAAVAGRRVAPDALAVNEFVRERADPPRIDWEHWLVAGMAVGSFLVRRPGGSGSSAAARPLASMLGGAMAMAGARMAGGCTSGHALTGTAQRAASSWTFTPVMFGSAALAERLRRKVSA